jgi:hypothetical protein
MVAWDHAFPGPDPINVIAFITTIHDLLNIGQRFEREFDHGDHRWSVLNLEKSKNPVM